MIYPSSRRIGDLNPTLQALYYKFDMQMKAEQIDYIVTCTYRNLEDQTVLYAKGRTAPGPKVTNARAGESKHNATLADGSPASEAFDIAIMEHGKIDWDISNPKWHKAGMIGKSLGLEWAGDWVSFKEYPHFQLKKV